MIKLNSVHLKKAFDQHVSIRSNFLMLPSVTSFILLPAVWLRAACSRSNSVKAFCKDNSCIVRQKCEENIATVAVTLRLPFHCFHVPLPEKVPMVYSVTPATVSAATSPTTSVPYAATAPANQVCSSLQLSVINPSALNKCFIFQSGLASSPQHCFHCLKLRLLAELQ